VEARSLIVRDLEEERLPWRHAAVSQAPTDCVLQLHTKRGIDDPGEAGAGNQPEVNEGRRLEGVGLNADERAWLT
jgi:hypothetical protein